MGSLRVGHDWATSLSLFTFTHWRRKWQHTPVFLPGESQGQGSLVGCCLWGRTELNTTEATSAAAAVEGTDWNISSTMQWTPCSYQLHSGQRYYYLPIYLNKHFLANKICNFNPLDREMVKGYVSVIFGNVTPYNHPRLRTIGYFSLQV